MGTLRSPVFIICLLLFIIHQVLQQYLHINMWWADYYLDNLLAMPVVLTLLLAERRWFFKNPAYRLTLLEVIIATLYFILVTEILFPLFSQRFAGDWADALAYFAGTALFYQTINKPRKRVHKKEG